VERPAHRRVVPQTRPSLPRPNLARPSPGCTGPVRRRMFPRRRPQARGRRRSPRRATLAHGPQATGILPSIHPATMTPTPTHRVPERSLPLPGMNVDMRGRLRLHRLLQAGSGRGWVRSNPACLHPRGIHAMIHAMGAGLLHRGATRLPTQIPRGRVLLVRARPSPAHTLRRATTRLPQATRHREPGHRVKRGRQGVPCLVSRSLYLRREPGAAAAAGAAVETAIEAWGQVCSAVC